MRWSWLVVATVMASGQAEAGRVSACIGTHGTALTGVATRVASAAFATAGVELAWQCPDRASAGGVLRIDVIDHAPAGAPSGALAASHPYAGCARAITVYYDRVRALARGTGRETTLLAYVLVHEITHVVQGVHRHSPAGVMKAAWDTRDQAAIFERRLPFDPWDIRLLQRGIDAGACDAGRRVMVSSSPGTGSRRE